MEQKSLCGAQRGGIVAAKVYAAPTELAGLVGWFGSYKDIAPTKLCSWQHTTEQHHLLWEHSLSRR